MVQVLFPDGTTLSAGFMIVSEHFSHPLWLYALSTLPMHRLQKKQFN